MEEQAKRHKVAGFGDEVAGRDEEHKASNMGKLLVARKAKEIDSSVQPPERNQAPLEFSPLNSISGFYRTVR